MFSEKALARVGGLIDRMKDAVGCWEWPMSKTAAGYGQLSARVGGKQKVVYAHRVAYYITHGELPKGLHVCHKCDNPACFRPSHLFIGSARDNMADMAKKGRSKKGRKFPMADNTHWATLEPNRVRGANNGCAKINEALAVMIVQSTEKGVTLAARLGVTPALISAVRHGKAWGHVTQALRQAPARSRDNK